MERSRFSDEQIIAIVKEQEAGMATAEVWARGRQWRSRRDATSVGAWTSYRTHWPAAGGSGF